MPSFRHISWKALAFSLVYPLLASVVAGASVGTVLRDQTVYRVDGLGTDEPEFREILELGIHRAVAAVDQGDRWLVIGQRTSSDDPLELIRVDSTSGTPISATPLDLPPDVRSVSSLDAGADGRLWLIARADEGFQLAELDPASAELTQRFDLDRKVGGLTFVGDTAYTLTREEEGTALAEVDTSTGSLTLLGAFDDFFCLRAADLAFDDEGLLHVMSANHLCAVIIPFPELLVRSYRVGPEGSLEPIVLLALPVFDLPISLDVRGGVSPIAVPTLGSLGLAAMLGLLVLSGIVALGRRSRVSAP